MAPAVSSLSLVPTEGASLADIDTLLTEQLGCTRVAAGRLARVFYDTFDHRLHRAGLVAEHEWLDGRRWLRVRRSGHSTALVQAACDTVPRQPAALADRRLREVLVGPCGGRALLPLVATDGEQYRYARTDELDKTIVRISVLTAVAVRTDPFAVATPPAGPLVDAGRARHVLDPVVTVVAVRGHEDAFTELCAALSARLGEREALDPLRRAAAATGVELDADPADRSVAVAAPQSAADLARSVLGRAAEVLAAQVAGIEAAADDEFLHDLRVTLRATRALVRVADGVLDPDDAAELLARLRALMDLTSPVRDLDVLRERWPREPEAVALAVALEALAPDDEQARRALLAALRGPELDALLAKLRSARAASSGAADPDRATAGRWAAAVLPAELRRLRRRAAKARQALEASGAADRSLTPDGHPAAIAPEAMALLHRTRKQAKRLRYLLDVFGPIYGPSLKGFRRTLKATQQCLGRFQDDCVAHDALERAAARLGGSGGGGRDDTEVLLALGRRSEQLRRDRAEAAAAFVDVFAPLASHHRRHRRRLRAAADGPPPPGPPPDGSPDGSAHEGSGDGGAGGAP